MREKIHIKTMTDYHLHDFIRCPYKFYFRYIKGREQSSLQWKQIVQMIVNRVVSEYYTAPVKKQTVVFLLEVLEKHWKKVSIRLFSSKTEYYMILAKVTDHLLQYIKEDEGTEPPLFLYEKLQTHMEELGVHISLTFDVGKWSEQSFVIKKYVVDADKAVWDLFQKLTTVFCYKAFGSLPERIEMIDVIEGTKRMVIPKQEDVLNGMKDLQMMKEMLQEPGYYTKRTFGSQCMECAFRKECESNDRKSNNMLH